MDRMLYVAMSGARESMLAQATSAQNLANLSTRGFREDLESMISKPIYGPGYPDRAYAISSTLSPVNFKPGAMETTGRDLDVAVAGEGWILVQGSDGEQGVSRRGDLKVSAEGLLQNGVGQLVMGNSGPIAIPPNQKLTIGDDGTISVRGLGQQANALAIVDRIMLVNPPLTELNKDTSGMLRSNTGDYPPDANVRLISGTLEGSNVNAVAQMTRMIELQRHYEIQVKLMNTAKENGDATRSIMRLGS